MPILVISILFVIPILGFIGARRGLIKEIFSLAALGLVLIFARPLGLILEPFLNYQLQLPALLSLILSPIAGGFLILLIVGLFGMLIEKLILAKKEKDRKRVNWIGGAIVGSLKGVAFILILVIVLHNFGVAAETIKIFGLRNRSGLTANLIDLKDRLDKSIIGGLLRKTNPLPQESFSIVDDLIDIVKDPEALERIAYDPEIQTDAQSQIY